MLAIAITLSTVVGVSLGLLGGGGSILMLPLLRYALGMRGHEAIAVSLLVVGSTSAAAVVPHARASRVRWRTALVLGVAGMVGAFAAGRAARVVPAPVLLGLFGLVMFATAIAMMRGRDRQPTPGVRNNAELPVGRALAQGLIVGAISGAVGAGGGFLVVPALVLAGSLPMDVAIGTSLVVIAMQSFAGLAGHLDHVAVDWNLAAAVTASAVLGSIVGAALAGRVSPARLRRGFAWLVVAMAFFILGQEVPRALGVEPPMAWVLVGTALGVGAVAAIVLAATRREGASTVSVARS